MRTIVEPEHVYDIAIIGNGPGAATFARRIAGSGLKVCMVDAEQDLPHKPCGGLLAPDAQKIMAEYDFVLPKEILVDPQIFSVKTMDLVSGVSRSYQRYYLNMDRNAFNRLLVDMVPDEVDRIYGKAVSAGSFESSDARFEIKVARSKEGARSAEEGARSAEEESAGDGQEEGEVVIRANYIIGADGGSSLVRRTFFDRKILQYIAIQQWFRYNHPSNLYYSCIFDSETSESCSWIIHKDEHIIYGGCFEKRGGREAFEKQKVRVSEFTGLDMSEPVYTEACLACRPRRMKDFVTGCEGVYLVGEAAGFISASSLEGISFAMRSGEMLAEAFLAALSGGREDGRGGVSGGIRLSDARIAKVYRRKTRKLRLKLMTKVIKHKILFTQWSRNIIMRSGVASVSEKR